MKQVFDLAADAVRDHRRLPRGQRLRHRQNNLKNVPEKLPNAWTFGSPGTAGTQLMFYA